MRTNDISGELQRDFEPQPLAISPDGGIAVTRQALDLPPPPRLCEAGPCRHYHRFVTQLDNEQPLAGAVAQGEQHGKLEGSRGPLLFYVKVHRYCYPTVGIESDLGELPVLDCNRWDPGSSSENPSSVRAQYKAALTDWHEKRLEAGKEPDMPTIERVFIVIDHNEHDCAVDGTETLRTLRAIVVAGMHGHQADANLWTFYDGDGNAITNVDATLHDLGIVDGERLNLRKGA